MKKEIIRGCLTLMIILLTSAIVHAGSLDISLDNDDAGSGDSVIALISVDTGAKALGAFQLELVYDPEELDIESVEAGETPFFKNLNWKIDNSKGVVKLNAFQGFSMSEPIGDIGIATFKIMLKKENSTDQLFQIITAEFFTPEGNSIKID